MLLGAWRPAAPGGAVRCAAVSTTHRRAAAARALLPGLAPGRRWDRVVTRTPDRQRGYDAGLARGAVARWRGAGSRGGDTPLHPTAGGPPNPCGWWLASAASAGDHGIRPQALLLWEPVAYRHMVQADAMALDPQDRARVVIVDRSKASGSWRWVVILRKER